MNASTIFYRVKTLLLNYRRRPIAASRGRIGLACLAISLLSLGAAPAGAAPFYDDFSSDTSADYTLDNSFGSGGAFNVSGGKLNLTPGNSNTLSVLLDNGTHLLLPGETFSVDMPASPWTNANYGQFIIVSSTVGQPANGTGWRIRRDWRGGVSGSVWLQDSLTGSANVSNDGNFGHENTPTGNLRFIVERDTNGLDFDFYYLDLDTVSAPIVQLGSGTLPIALASTPLYVGVQAWKDNSSVPSHVFSFDNFSITAPVPETSTYALGIVGTLGVALLLWRRRRIAEAA